MSSPPTRRRDGADLPRKGGGSEPSPLRGEGARERARVGVVPTRDFDA